jgi:hypothetical protein
MERTNEYTFDILKRYVTKGISEKLSNTLVFKLWGILDDFISSDIKKDYLQVFKINANGNQIEIRHFQEEPVYTKSHLIELENSEIPVTLRNEGVVKIYIIDDISHSTMLLAEEY